MTVDYRWRAMAQPRAKKPQLEVIRASPAACPSDLPGHAPTWKSPPFREGKLDAEPGRDQSGGFAVQGLRPAVFGAVGAGVRAAGADRGAAAARLSQSSGAHVSARISRSRAGAPAILPAGLAAVARSGDGCAGAAALANHAARMGGETLPGCNLCPPDLGRGGPSPRPVRPLVGLAVSRFSAGLQPAAALGVSQFPVRPWLGVVGFRRLGRVARARLGLAAGLWLGFGAGGLLRASHGLRRLWRDGA